MIALALAAVLALPPGPPRLTPDGVKWLDALVQQRNDPVPWSLIFDDDHQAGGLSFTSSGFVVSLGVCARNHPEGKGWVVFCAGNGIDSSNQYMIRPFADAIVAKLTESLPTWRSSGWIDDNDGMPDEFAEKFTMLSSVCDKIIVRRFLRPAAPYLPANGAVQLTVWMAPDPPCVPEHK